ncbi:MAG: hypothetical protein WCE80_13025, partial [Acidimicrobiia bacterium]
MTPKDLMVMNSEGDLFANHGAALTRIATILAGPSDAEEVVADALASLIESGSIPGSGDPRALASGRSWPDRAPFIDPEFVDDVESSTSPPGLRDLTLS